MSGRDDRFFVRGSHPPGERRVYRMDDDQVLRVMVRAWTDGWNAACEVGGQAISPEAAVKRVASIKAEMDEQIALEMRRRKTATLVDAGGNPLVQ